jgi:hypothetical protein
MVQGNAPKTFFGEIFSILMIFVIFSVFLNLSRIKGLGFGSSRIPKMLYILYCEK